MDQLKPDLVARVHLYRTEEGGRGNTITGGRFGCPLVYDGEAFDCRILLGQGGASLAPGQTADVFIKFLRPDLIKPRLQAGSRFKLWEGKDFADGEVLEVVS
jgi:hypothetical protein